MTAPFARVVTHPKDQYLFGVSLGRMGFAWDDDKPRLEGICLAINTAVTAREKVLVEALRNVMKEFEREHSQNEHGYDDQFDRCNKCRAAKAGWKALEGR